MTVLSGWGRYPKLPATLARIRSDADVASALGRAPVIARGNGRSYGDSAVAEGLTLDMRGMDRMMSFEDGVLVAEAGVLLGDVVASFLPRGWFPAVTPGTRFVTLGGAIAADVHGKNHHLEGSFCDFVDWVEVMAPDGTVRRVMADDAEFDWIRGGMGLTGIILRAAIRLRPVETAWIRQDSQAAPNLEAAIDQFEARMDATYAVAWIDGLAGGGDLGRAIVLFGEHATPDDLPAGGRAAPFTTPRRRSKSVPMTLPGFALNRWTVRAFNELYYRRGRSRSGADLVDWERYFYPLDSLRNWTRIYGPKGFVQFQCVLPLASARDGLRALLTEISASGQASFLAVLKRMGPQRGRFSFPQEGYTLALDFPVNDRSLALMHVLDQITLHHGGRLYLAKDARMPADVLAKADPRGAELTRYRRDRGHDRAFVSAQSARLGL